MPTSPEARERPPRSGPRCSKPNRSFRVRLDAALKPAAGISSRPASPPRILRGPLSGHLDPAEGTGTDPILVAVAAKVDGTRLIDNIPDRTIKHLQEEPMSSGIRKEGEERRP